jgi:hypothetical protein
MNKIIMILFFVITSCGYDKKKEHSIEINPRLKLNEEELFYGDSVYYVSKRIDTVLSSGQWMDSLHRKYHHKK